MNARDRKRTPWLFLSPYVAASALFFVYPFVQAARLAFYQTNGPQSRAFVGLANFRFLLADPDFHTAFWNTSVYAFWALLLQVPLALGLALAIDRLRGRSRAWARLALFAPNLVGSIFVGILFGVLLAPRYGLVNRGLQAVLGWGLEQRWVEDPALVMPALVVASLWMYVGFNVLYFSAGLQSVDRTLVDAARVDGANPLQVFWHVTLPALRPVTTFVVLMSLIGSYQVFELPLALLAGTNGFGPQNAGLTLMTYLNDVAFNRGDLGLGSAVGWVLTIVLFVLSLAQLRGARLLAGEEKP